MDDASVAPPPAALAGPPAGAVGQRWWQTGFIYQIYPLSFMDGNGDGYGDLPGIIDRLDHVVSLGAAGIWLNPIHPSPLKDFGYDISDYLAIHPLLGTMADFERLVTEIHRRGLRLILDLVPNHTSDEHPWFVASRSSRDDAKRDWYIWRDPAPSGGPPTNWMSYFGSGSGSAWTFDERTGQYYFHQFREGQPELNYASPQVLEAMLDTMRFWLDRGVDGFRVDVVALLAKDDRFLDEPPNPDYDPSEHVYNSLRHIYTANVPAVHGHIRAMRRVLDEYDDRVLIGELDPIDLMDYYGPALDEIQLPFNFHLLKRPWEASVVRRIADEYDAGIPPGAWPDWVLGNHDQPRIASRVGVAQARLAQMMLLTLRGTPFCYYGDELGMTDVPIPAERFRDMADLDPLEMRRYSRDPSRTPMRWDAGPNAGFCPPRVEPWLPLGPDHTTINVAVEERDPRSILWLFRRLSALRRGEAAIATGAYRSLDAGSDAVFAYERFDGTGRFAIALNFSDRPQRARLPGRIGEIVLSTELDREGEAPKTEIELRPNEGLVVRIHRSDPEGER